MQFNVSGLIQDGIGATRRYELDGILESEERAPEAVTGNVEFLRTNVGVLVRAKLRLVEPDICSRCLNPLEETLPIEFEEEFFPTVDVQSGRPTDEASDEDAFSIDEHHMLDLTEAIRQYRESSAVLQPLCRPDCLGLCHSCGHDLNTGPCDCAAVPTDNRWAALTGLLPTDENSEIEGKD